MNNESKRLDNLKSYELHLTSQGPSFDHLTRLASMICKTPIALICFVDDEKAWVKSSYGMSFKNAIPKNEAFCTSAIQGTGILEIKDASLDPKFKNFAAVKGEPHVKFYAGHPLRSKEGYNLGVLCVVDTKPRELTSDEREALASLAQQAVELIVLGKVNAQLQEQQDLVLNKARLQTIGELASGVCHQINNPLAIIVGRTMIMKTMLKSKLPDDAELVREVDLIEKTTNRVSGILKSLRMYAKDMGNQKDKSNINELIDDALTLIRGKMSSSQVMLNYEKGEDLWATVNKNQISQVILDLLNNAVEGMEETPVKNIDLKVTLQYGQLSIKVSDTGKGIRPEDENKIFEPFFTTKLRHFGVGLSNARTYMHENKGSIQLLQGKNPTVFELTIPTA